MAKLTLLEQHRSYMKRFRATGGRVGSYKCPGCKRRIAICKPPKDDGEQWDSLTRCPYCNYMVMGIQTYRRVRAVDLPELN